MTDSLKKAHGNWVDGDRFFNREKEQQLILERFREGAHILLTAQRRMGKTSLVREIKRQLTESGEAYAIFVDLEESFTPADAIAEISLATKEFGGVFDMVKTLFANTLKELTDSVEKVSAGDFDITLRAGVSESNWQKKGDDLFKILSELDKPVLLAIDELPILINRMLKGQDFKITEERREITDKFMSWLRKNAQTHKGKVGLILSGSIGLEPVLMQAGLSANKNVFPPFELKPWSHSTAIDCLNALANNYQITFDDGVCEKICASLGVCIPNHIQLFFNLLHESAQYMEKNTISIEDVERVYSQEMLSVHSQVELDHYEERLKLVLGEDKYTLALDLLTEVAVTGKLDKKGIEMFSAFYRTRLEEDALTVIREIIFVLEHDGYLESSSEGYIYISKLLCEWWKARYENFYTVIIERGIKK